jgi:hypothetical protein
MWFSSHKQHDAREAERDRKLGEGRNALASAAAEAAQLAQDVLASMRREQELAEVSGPMIFATDTEII